MKAILKARWAILVVWVVLAAVLTVFLPDLNAIINDRGNVMLDSGYPSQQAQKLMNNLSMTKGKSGILVFTDKNKLSAADKENISAGLQKLKDNKEALGITGVVDIFDTPKAESQLVSKDGTTMLVQFTYEKNGRDIKAIRAELEAQVKDITVTHYITGDEFISNDYVSQIMQGVEKSALLTVAFILIVLILMFRSVVTPLISLASVGISYLVSIGIVGQLVDKLGFPISTLTQMFIILILFGVGTDYNILLFNRFKEEMQKHDSIDDAIAATYRTAGKTVLFSAATVFIAFLSLQFVKFGVYRSAVAVAIGIAVLIAVLFTITPAVFKILGKRLFWPSKSVTGHKQSRVWEKVTSLSVKRPYLALIVIALAILPVILVGSYKLTFDNLKDMGNSTAPSVVGFNTVADHFGKGKIMPVTVVIKSDKAMDNNGDLTLIDSLTERLRKLDGVSSVSGPTQPEGKEIADFYTDSQTKQVSTGLTGASGGIRKISDGLTTMHDKLAAPDFSQVDELATGTATIQKGMQSITAALKQIQAGMDSGAAGSKQIADNIGVISTNLNTISDTLNNKLLPGYKGLKTGMDQWAGGYVTMEQNLAQLTQMAQGIQATAEMLNSSSDPTAQGVYTTLIGTQQAPGLLPQLVGALNGLDGGLKTANDVYTNQFSPNFTGLNNGLEQISGGLPAMVGGLSDLQKGADGLSSGLSQASGGQAQIAENMQKMTEALKKIADGQAALASGLDSMGSSLTQLKDGIGASRDGLNQVSSGLDQANTFLSQLESVKSFYIPKEALKNSDVQKAFDAFMSKDRKTAEITVTLESDPYSDEAVHTVDSINNLLSTSLKDTSLSNAQVLAGGQSSVTNDLKKVATSDMTTTQIVVLAAVFILLIIVIKSFWIPVYIAGSIMVTYYSTIALTNLITRSILHTSELAWNVPFFAFLVIVTLGVDYSIFLMTRFREYRGSTPHEAIIRASANIGSVVISAAIILAGTFATIIPAGINTLVELAIAVCLGILMLSIVFLPFVIPSFISIQDWLNRRYGFNSKER